MNDSTDEIGGGASQSSDSFCDSPVWDAALTWNTSTPDLTPCFQRIVLTSIPCIYFLLFLPLHIHVIRMSKRQAIGHSWLNISQTVVTLIVAVLALADMFRAVHEHTAQWKFVPTVDFVAPLSLFIAFIVCIVLTQVGRLQGIRSSGVLFVFWFLLATCHLFILISKCRNAVIQGSVEDLFRFVIFVFHYVGVLVMTVLSCFVERVPVKTGLDSDLPPCPEYESSFISRITFWWCTSLIVKGYKSALERKDLWMLNDVDKSSVVLPKFEKNWNEEMTRSQKSRAINEPTKESAPMKPMLAENKVKVVNPKRQYEPSLLKSLVKTFGLYFGSSIFFKLVHDIIMFVQPQLLRYMINFTWDQSQPQWKGFLYASGLFGAAQIQSLVLHAYFHRCTVTGMRLRSAIVAAVYKKSLRLSSASRKESTVGEIVNLMSVDAQRFMELTTYLNIIWSGPLQISVALYFLWQILGPSVLVGLAVTVLLIPVNGVIAHFSKKLQVTQMKNKDVRIKYMSEILNGMRVLKLYAWEQSFMDVVLGIRKKELDVLKKQAYLNSVSTFTWNIAPFLVSLSTFAVYVMSSPDHVLDAERAFVSLSLFNILRFPLFMLPMMISTLVQASVSLKRLLKFLKLDELDLSSVSRSSGHKAEHAIRIEDGSFSWSPGEEAILHNIGLNVKPGSLVAIVGQVGAGKSSLLSAVLGEMEKISGKVDLQGSIAYVPQQAWIQNSTFEENILFSKDRCKVLYQQVIDSCALGPDLEILSDGDQTEIGEKGINLSGGQKQRVSMARAVYNDADIYLLDDPLSAVDAHVGKHMFEKVIGPQGMLRGKTRLLVTHGISFLHQMDWVVVLGDGQIKEEGTYKDLMMHAGPFAEFIKNYLAEECADELAVEFDDDAKSLKDELVSKLSLLFEGSQDVLKIKEKSKSHHALHNGLTASNSSLINMPLDVQFKTQGKSRLRRKSLSCADINQRHPRFNFLVNGSLSNLRGIGSQTLEVADLGADEEDKLESKEAEKLIKAEKAETGNVKLTVFFTYFKALGIPASCLIVLLFALTQAAKVGADIWLSDWSNEVARNNGTMSESARDRRLGVYGAFGFIGGVLEMSSAFIMAYGGFIASKFLHKKLLEAVFLAPMQYFDVTPIGRIMNRFSDDLAEIDFIVPFTVRSTINGVLVMIATIVVISYTIAIAMISIPLLLVLYIPIQRFYVATSRQLKRLESVSRSPIYSHFGETVTGATVIRAFGHQERFIQESHRRVDENQIAYYPNIVSNRWLAIRLELVATLVVLFAAIFAVLGRDHLSPGIVGLSITYALSVTQILNWMVRMSSELETNIVAVERIKEYSETETEAAWSICDKKPKEEWPPSGEIEFKDYSVRYREGLDLVLKGINVHIHAGEKVGVVGRTGAGKSSLVMGLFRILEPAGGTIHIDGVNITDIGLHDLRSKLTVIPQDPVLFSGTLRMNLDPFDKHTDEEVWKALEYSHLKNFVNSLSSGLLHEVSEGGENISVGQRQLVCLARALLRKTKILVLDEATAAIDLETDDLIQSSIRTQFSECTVVTIAHRINTVMDYTRILALETGEVKEFDSPTNLLKDRTSLFYSLAKSAGLTD
ncbi:multidrug resistance-associated protein 1-like [Lineus longissimus]|uniref:multidrug resistance-associated protein 1-like n=1 Tax=Lineus longissimus TaxID=88925 RepID=UPI002B4D7FA8